MAPLSDKSSFEIRQEVIKSIGKEDVAPFELWAFGESPTKYSTKSLSIYNLSRNGYSRVPENLDEGLPRLTDMWKERFS